MVERHGRAQYRAFLPFATRAGREEATFAGSSPKKQSVFIIAECLYRCSSSGAVNHPLFRIDRFTKKETTDLRTSARANRDPPLFIPPLQYYKSAVYTINRQLLKVGRGKFVSLVDEAKYAFLSAGVVRMFRFRAIKLPSKNTVFPFPEKIEICVSPDLEEIFRNVTSYIIIAVRRV